VRGLNQLAIRAVELNKRLTGGNAPQLPVAAQLLTPEVMDEIRSIVLSDVSDRHHDYDRLQDRLSVALSDITRLRLDKGRLMRSQFALQKRINELEKQLELKTINYDNLKVRITEVIK
jgi:hypothetical protein